MDLHCTRIDGEKFIVSSEEVMEIIPFAHLFCSNELLAPMTALIHYQSSILPIHGALPAKGSENAWIIVYKSHGEVLLHLPELVGADAEDSIQALETTAQVA